MTKQEYFSTMPDQLLCECIKEIIGLKEGFESVRSFLNDENISFNSEVEVIECIFKEAAKRYLKIKMLQS